MKRELLNAIGINARVDIPAQELGKLNLAKYNIDYKDYEKICLLMDVITEYNKETIYKTPETITTAADAAKLLAPELQNLDHEEGWVLFLTAQLNIIDKERLFVGGNDNVSFDKRIIVKKALEKNALNIILFHNHPSGDPLPSNCDLKMTEELKVATDVFNMTLCDHIIIGKESFFSFAEEKMFKFSKLK